MTSLLKVTSPRTTSLNVTSTPAGTLKRMTGCSPSSIRVRTSLRRQLTARARISRRPSGGEHFAAVGVELLRRTETVVRVAAGQQLVGVGRIEVQPLRLPIRPVRPLDVRPFVPVEPEPAQVVEDAGLRLTRRALDVGVLDPQDERAVLAVREQPVEERRARVADVQLTGWRWGETYAH